MKEANFNKKVFKSRIGELIDNKRDLGNIKAKEQAKEIGIDFGTLFKYKRGELIPRIDALYELAKYYNVSADFLLGLSESNAPNINDRDIVEKLGLTDRSRETLQLIKENKDLKTGWHNYSLYLEIINLLIQYGNFKDLNHTLHDYLFFNTSKAHFAEYASWTDNEGKERITDLPQNCIPLSDNKKIISIAADDLSESILESMLISKFRALKREILENKLKNISSLLEEERERKRKAHNKNEVESGKYKKN